MIYLVAINFLLCWLNWKGGNPMQADEPLSYIFDLDYLRLCILGFHLTIKNFNQLYPLGRIKSYFEWVLSKSICSYTIQVDSACLFFYSFYPPLS